MSALLSVASPVAGARIGPNALIQTAAALLDAIGPARAGLVLAAADEWALLAAPPAGMVDERRFTRLTAALAAALGDAEADAVLRDAGERTARYLLAHRIPRAFQRLLAVLPPRLATRLLLAAIRRHAWTFAGSGRFEARVRRGRVWLRIAPSATGPLPGFYAGTFEVLFRTLCHPAIRLSSDGGTAPGCTLGAALPRTRGRPSPPGAPRCASC